MAKKKNLIWIAVAGLAIWYLWKKNKAAGGSGAGGGGSVQATGAAAQKLVEAAIDQTKFVTDTTTDADRYKQDKAECL